MGINEDKSDYDIAADLGFPPIKTYQDEVAARGYLTNREYRAILREGGTRIPTRHENLMDTKFNRDDPIEVTERDEEMDLFAKNAEQIESKIQAELTEIKANARTTKERQIEYDEISEEAQSLFTMVTAHSREIETLGARVV